MKMLLLSTAILGAAALPALAQDMEVFRGAADPMEIRASDLIGHRIYASEAAVDADEYEGLQEGWDDIGEVNDVILSRDATVQAVLVDVGGFLGIGERQVAVSMGALRFVADSATADAADDYFLVLNVARADIEAAPAYVEGEAAAEAAALEAEAATETEMEAEETAAVAAAGTTTDEAATTDMATETTGDTTTTVVTEETTETVTDDAMATDGTAIARDGYLAAPAELITADALQGAPVYDSNDQRVGEVSELLLSEAGQITDVIVDVGGFLGIGEKPVAMQMGNIEILQREGGGDLRVYVADTREQLEAMPTYEN